MNQGKSSSGWLIVLALLWLALLGGAVAVAVRALTAPGAPPYHASDQAHDGLISYAQHCASCHGPDLEGTGAPALVGDAFLAGWSERSVHDLLEYVRTEMPQGRGGTLSDTAYERSTAYILARNGFPGGDTPLRVGDARLADLSLDPALATASPELPDVAAADEASIPAAGEAADPEDASSVPPAEAGVGEPVVPAAQGTPVRALGTMPVYLAQAQEEGDGAPGDGAAGEGDGGGGGDGGGDAGGGGDGGNGAAAGDGAAVYEANCATCHGAQGEGAFGPALAGTASLEDAQGVVLQIVNGGGGMPAFGDQLSNDEIAAVASHVRTQWGNDFGEVSEDQVAQAQGGGDGAGGGDAGGGAGQDGDGAGQDGDGGDGAGDDDDGGESEGGDGEGGGEGEGAGGGADEGGAGVPGPDAGAGDGQADVAASDGAAVYERSCAHCHGAEGAGEVGPALAGNAALQDAEAVIRQILEGGNGMPAFAGQLDVAQVAAVASHVRTRWGNDFGEVSRDAVAQAQAGDAAGGDGGSDGDGEGAAAAANGDDDADGGEGGAAEAEGDGEADEPTVVLPDEGAVAAGDEGQGLPEVEEADDGDVFAAFGERLYARHCAACHAGDGTGGIGPSLVRNPRLDDGAWTIRRILVGANAMPAFGAVLSSEGVAAVTTHIRTQWGNEAGSVAPDAVAAVADGLTLEQLNPVAAVDLDSAPVGHQRYVQLCSACHGLQGGGDVGPPLAGNANLADEQLVLSAILYGRDIMPPFSHHPDEDLAAIASYVRTSWSNAFGAVDPAQVRQYRPRSDAGASGGGGAGQDGAAGQDVGGGQDGGGQQDGGSDEQDGGGGQDGDAVAIDDAPADETPRDEESP